MSATSIRLIGGPPSCCGPASIAPGCTTWILSTHLPPAAGHLAEFLDVLEEVPQTAPWVGPDQQALEAMLAQFEPTPVVG